MVITDVKLISKKGGLSDYLESLKGLKVGVITVSDRAYEGIYEDRSGEEAIKLIEELGGQVVYYKIVPDDENELIKAIGEAEELADVIITTGGTGISPRDITISALKKIAEKEIKGFGEAMRIFGVRYTPKALLSNCSGFVLNNGKIVIALPGSPLAVRDYIHLLGGLIKHALDMAKGKGHENNN